MFEGEGRWEWYFQTPDGETYDGFSGRIGAWLSEPRDGPLIVVAHGLVTRVLRGLYAGLPRAEALRLAVPQDRIFLLADGTLDEIAV
jgi:broad specificity phosphatase PhoE